MTESPWNSDRLADALAKLPDRELALVLRRVFQGRVAKSGMDEERFSLGLALRSRDSEDPDARWHLSALAYPDGDQYGTEELGPDWGFCQEGACEGCGLPLRSNVKQAVCPLCGGEVLLT